MKKLIRSGAFETNSSSSHVITISDTKDLSDTIYPDEDGVIYLDGGEFGWEWEHYTSALSKANYLAVYFKSLPDYRDDFTETNSLEMLELLKKVIIDHTGAKSVEIEVIIDWEEARDKGSYPSYIDHQSIESPAAASECHTEEKIKQFLFSPQSILETGNDNSDAPAGFILYEEDQD